MIKVGADMTNVMNTYSQPSVTFPHKFKAKILNVAPYTPSIYITKQNTTILWHYYEFRTSPAHHGKSANNTIHQSSQNPSLRQRLYIACMIIVRTVDWTERQHTIGITQKYIYLLGFGKSLDRWYI
jgi:hypothetical protein